MPTRIAFSTHYPDRMKELAGKPTRFPEKLITMIDPYAENEKLDDLILQILISGIYDFNFKVYYPPKTTTIRSNYEYWKSKEGQLIQPYFWAGKPYRSKQVVFCPEVRLAKVLMIRLFPMEGVIIIGDDYPEITNEELAMEEGFDSELHFWMWFDQDMDGALLKFESVVGLIS